MTTADIAQKPGPGAAEPDAGAQEGRKGPSRKLKIAIGLVFWFGIWIALGIASGIGSIDKNFEPQNEFKVTPWIEIKLGPVDISINKFVFFVLLTAICVIVFFLYIAHRMERSPDRKQTVLELIYDFAVEQLGRANMPEAMFRKWFGYVATLFVFILFTNLLGYIPFPTNSEYLIGGWLPAFGLYAASANLSLPLALAMVSVYAYHSEGIRQKGLIGYLKGWVPPGVPKAARAPLFVIEVISHSVRLISLSARLFANVLAGHLLIIMMLGMIIIFQTALAGVLLVPIAVGFYIFEVVLIAGLQAFIFSVLTAIYIGQAVAEEH